MPARVKKLILPKKFSLIKQELPRVIQDGDGKRYVEELDDKGESFPNALFESGDGDIRMAGGLELEAASERRRAVEPAPTVPNPENQVAIQLSNARSENEELHSQIAQLLSSSDGSEIAQLRRELQASQSTVAVHVDRIATLEAENNRLSALSDGQEFSRLRSALEESERNVNLLERAAGNSGSGRRFRRAGRR
jgi:hypothetical protein